MEPWAITVTSIPVGKLEVMLRDAYNSTYPDIDGARSKQFDEALEAVYILRGALDGHIFYNATIGGHDDFITVTLGGSRE